MGGEGQSRFDIEAERAKYEAVPQFQELQAQTPDALEMITSTRSEEGLVGKECIDYQDNIGKGMGGFYDDIRENGCSICGSYAPGCCDGCAQDSIQIILKL